MLYSEAGLKGSVNVQVDRHALYQAPPSVADNDNVPLAPHSLFNPLRRTVNDDRRYVLGEQWEIPNVISYTVLSPLPSWVRKRVLRWSGIDAS